MNTLDVGPIPTSPKKVLDNNFKIVYNTIVPRERDAEMPEKAISKCSEKNQTKWKNPWNNPLTF